ncbi:putative Ig domain-containing protein [Planomonospora sp. ID91781]|uniref:putative Ig domain-containing protein n=1 Tax=Planomonospora sp. ID91781 TaxID=2738135 RepID=UPI0018C3EA58|nr:putative Ig domain-containing protein [Planomonospora sp. ID91781]MBG0821112.1 putative Ig domain-containing protein [Planomonospora sp. ID91781]
MPAGRADRRAAGARTAPPALAAVRGRGPRVLTAVCDRASREPAALHGRASARPVRGDGEAGFTLMEVLVSMAVIGTVMASLTVFFTNSLAFTGQQRSRQVAAQLAGDGIERARALKGSALLAGRGKLRVTDQWQEATGPAGPDDVKKHLQATQPDWDPILFAGSDAGASAPLPTEPEKVSVNGVEYTRNWYVGRCRQQASPLAGSAAERACTDPRDGDPDPGSADVPFFRVVVAVEWRHKGCASEKCVYVTSTLVSPASEPIFNVKRTPPAVTNPGAQYGYRGTDVNLQLVATGGRLPLTWSAAGLPAGLSMSTGGLVTGRPTAPGTSPVTSDVTVTVTDRQKDADDVQFTWTVFDLPALTDPGDQVTRAGTAVSLAMQATGGRPALTWSATGLPAGLSIDASTGRISGTPTAYGTTTVTVHVTDKGGKTDAVTFTWKVLTLELAEANARASYIRDKVDGVRIRATGGDGPYTWRARNLPEGLEIDPATGEISGTAWQGTRYLTTVYVRDSAGDEISTTFPWRVRPRQPNDLSVTLPDPAAPDRTGAAGVQVTLAAEAEGGSNSGYNTWSAEGLPPGLLLTPVGYQDARITGRPTTRGTYTVTLRVEDSTNKAATLMFTWVVR